jgi:uncharacterized membrane protein
MDPAAPAPNIPLPPAPAPSWPREPRRLAAGRGTSWWGEGWRIFTAAPLPWLGIVAALLVINVALGFVPMVGWIASTVLGPVFAGGMLLGCHALARGQPLAFMHLFAAFQSDRLGPLALLGAIMVGFGIVAMLVMGVLFFGAGGWAMMSGFMGYSHGAGMGMGLAKLGTAALVGSLLGLVAASLFLLAWWFAPGLVTLNRAPPVDALKASFGACMANLGALTMFGLVFIGLAIVASIPMGLGWIVLAPVSVGATYASWREVFGD